MKIVLCLLLLASTCSRVSSEDIFINPWFIPAPSRPYQNLTAEVGDTISFYWNDTSTLHTVYIYPSLSCNGTISENIEVGLTSPALYVFTDADVDASPLFFACSTPNHCELGMRFFVDVVPLAGSDVPEEVNSTDVPTVAPDIGTEEPSNSTFDPTTIPATTESDAPSDVPTEAPVVVAEPTDAPILESDEPSAVPTEAPVVLVVPTSIPTDAANDLPSAAPSPGPVEAAATSKPVASPTLEPTLSKPTTGVTMETLTGVRMGMAGVSSFPGSTQETWSNFTASFSTSFIFSELGGVVKNFATTYEVTDVIPQSSRKERRLTGRDLQQQEQVIVVYTQTMTYVTTDDTITPDDLASAPFATDEEKTAYVTLLGTSGDQVLEQVTGVSNVIVAAVPTSAPVQPTQPPADSSSGLSTSAIIGIACGGGAVLIMAVLYFIYCRKSDSPTGKMRDEPPLHVSVNEDEISTLAGPQGGPPTYGDQSVATVDYDYSKAYGGAGDTSVSSAGGTFGSNAHNQFPSDAANAAATGAALGALDDGGSFHASYRDPKANVREDVLHIFAPPGKLGVVIDTPDDGAPVVHAIKDTSVIASKIQVGDKLVAVDDEDVRSMTAIKVSKLISRKSANPSRKLTVVRTTVIE